jgi:ubiquinone/menaquinone biosynthesis C-methylase UbiE
MTTIIPNNKPDLASRLINTILGIKPLAEFAKTKARNMMIERAEKIGVPWRENVQKLSNNDWESKLVQVENTNLIYPDYYVVSFHAYSQGNLSWEAAYEVESAAYAVHSTIYSPTPSPDGDPTLRQNYHKVLKEQITLDPQKILDIGCSVGMSTFPLQEIYPQAEVTGLDLSAYFLAVAKYNAEQRNFNQIKWLHGAAENTGLPSANFDLISSFLMFHELPQSASNNIFQEANRLLRPGGYFTMMDMNPSSSAYKKMPPYILTLLKSTEPYLDQYFTLDIEESLVKAGFEKPIITTISPRHRAIIAKKIN